MQESHPQPLFQPAGACIFRSPNTICGVCAGVQVCKGDVSLPELHPHQVGPRQRASSSLRADSDVCALCVCAVRRLPPHRLRDSNPTQPPQVSAPPLCQPSIRVSSPDMFCTGVCVCAGIEPARSCAQPHTISDGLSGLQSSCLEWGSCTHSR